MGARVRPSWRGAPDDGAGVAGHHPGWRAGVVSAGGADDDDGAVVGGDLSGGLGGVGVDAGAARRLQGVELHVEVLTGGRYAGVTDCDGHGLYETTPLAAGRDRGR